MTVMANQLPTAPAPIAALREAGVSVWLDDLSRERLRSGNLQEVIDTKGIVGVTTNPSIFQAALADGDAYTEQLTALAAEGKDVDEVVFALTTDDVREACDLFVPIYEATDGVDGRVSIEVDPRLAHDAEQTAVVAKQLAETVAVHELKFASGQHQQAGAVAQYDDASQSEPSQSAAFQAEFELPPPMPAPNTSAAARANMIETVRNSLEANRVDLYLQPIVTLPQRKVRYYEGLARLRTENGTIVMPSDFLGAAESSGLVAKVDNQMLFRCVQVIRRLQIKNREVGLFCNISPTTLNDPLVFPEILQFMDANRAIAPSLILEFRQSALRAMGPLETEALSSLRDLGFRFSMDAVTDLRMEPRDLGERGIRYVKVPSQFLLGDGGSTASDIHAADLSDLLGRFGISLIAEKIEVEAQVVDLLEYDVRFGQGYLFSQPRPVRNEALRGAGESDLELEEPADRPRRAVGGTGFTL